MSEFLNSIKEWLISVSQSANQYGLPIPLSLLVIFLFTKFRARWDSRQTYYCEIIKNLGIWKDSLSDRLDYYQEPGSEYQDEPDTDTYNDMSIRASKAFLDMREALNVARIFLSPKAILAMDKLITEHWHIKEHGAVCAKDYLESTYDEVKKAYECILSEARADLKKSQYAGMIKAVSKAVGK